MLDSRHHFPHLGSVLSVMAPVVTAPAVPVWEPFRLCWWSESPPVTEWLGLGVTTSCSKMAQNIGEESITDRRAVQRGVCVIGEGSACLCIDKVGELWNRLKTVTVIPNDSNRAKEIYVVIIFQEKKNLIRSRLYFDTVPCGPIYGSQILCGQPWLTTEMLCLGVKINIYNVKNWTRFYWLKLFLIKSNQSELGFFVSSPNRSVHFVSGYMTNCLIKESDMFLWFMFLLHCSNECSQTPTYSRAL